MEPGLLGVGVLCTETPVCPQTHLTQFVTFPILVFVVPCVTHPCPVVPVALPSALPRLRGPEAMIQCWELGAHGCLLNRVGACAAVLPLVGLSVGLSTRLLAVCTEL